jgi:hypothetical protein
MFYFAWNSRQDISVTEVASGGLDNRGSIFSIMWILGAFCLGQRVDPGTNSFFSARDWLTETALGCVLCFDDDL